MAQFLIANGIDLKQTDTSGSNALLLCQRSNSDKIVEVAQLLIANRVNVNHTDEEGMNALMLFCAHSQNEKIVEVTQLLIAAGVYLMNQKNLFYGHNALMRHLFIVCLQ